MNYRIDHVGEANALLMSADSAVSQNHPVNTGEYKADLIANAQVHATLALVEQQRIANLIALMQMQVECDENTDMLAGEAMHGLIEYERTPATPFSGPDDVAVIRAGIKEALGL